MSVLALPAPVAAHAPPEAQGLSRDDVAMLVATRSDGALVHARFRELSRFLAAGDLLVVNTSATLPAALPARLGRQAVELHLSTPLMDERWLVELRTREGLRFGDPSIGGRLELPDGAHAQLLARHLGSDRLCVARLALGEPLGEYLAKHGRPIRYGPDGESWPIEAYQTVFALEPGSVEMPSAGRPFTTQLVTELVARGVQVAPVTLHAGVSSLERGEAPYPERYQVPAATARLVNAVRAWGGRVIAVGTTVVRALETVAEPGGALAPGEGSTSLIVTPERGLRALDGILTGWHESDSSHLALLEAAAGPDLLERCYRAARAHGYVGHEFGDLNLILPLRGHTKVYSGVVGRTQVYLGDRELELLARVGRATGASRSELIRRAVQTTFGEKTTAEKLRALDASAGSWESRSFTGAEYVGATRGDLNERLRRVGLR